MDNRLIFRYHWKNVIRWGDVVIKVSGRLEMSVQARGVAAGKSAAIDPRGDNVALLGPEVTGVITGKSL